ncbi:hypothetical protein OF820_06535 [Oceanotoga sp. DSM 15011]|uniref:Cas10/Cmr2 second palm domain-containing protein n=1 Tax=Oceanotoga sp. DSM 15011 TaxID=2984951 RepID=UPI0021F3F250|nr:type III-B CRISPR-associated protein Cas10/Cmr2 [Oceanotoga sp. DSM 15011]UYP01340.1 hypothetical protein OF820_06535 [Oceanotoga sp. DSM 15011]
MNTYIGLTIGPIYKTISLSKKTAGLWGSSYIFSYIMEKIYNKMKTYNENGEIEIITPYIERFEKIGAGIFPDRFIFKVNNNNENYPEKLFEAIKSTKCELIEEYSKLVSIKNNFLDDFLKFNVAKITSDENNYMEKISNALNILDISDFGGFKTDTCKKYSNILDYFLNDNPLIKKSSMFENSNLKNSLIFKSNDDIPSTEKIKNINNNNNNNFKYTDYIVLVKADGDNLGKKLFNHTMTKEISKCLFSFSINAVNEINNYGALNIYAGGDDLLFIAPIISIDKSKTIFDLITKLKNIYEKEFNNVNNVLDTENEKTSLSFGVNIIHYKEQLFESLDDCSYLLENSKGSKNKNATSIKITKRSGTSYKLTFSNEENFFNYFNKVINQEINLQTLKGIAFKLNSNREFLKCIFQEEDKKTYLENYFENIFLNKENINRLKQYENAKKLRSDFIEELIKFMIKYEEVNDTFLSKTINYIGMTKFFLEKKGDEDNE